MGIIWIFGGCVVLLVLGVGVLVAMSNGRVRPVTGDDGQAVPGSIAEIAYAEISGMPQGMIIRGAKPQNPVLLFLHGGPGSPEYAFAQSAGLQLEKDFTVCWWDQRGAGLSYQPGIELKTMTVPQMVQDTVEVTRYLQRRFKQHKIYIMGHSWGSFLGLHVVQRYPHLYHAYIGVGQVTNQLESEKLAHAHMLQTATEYNDTKVARRLVRYEINDIDSVTGRYLLGPRTRVMNRYGLGMAREYSAWKHMVKPVLTLQEYTLKQKFAMLRGISFSLKWLFDDVLATNLFETINRVEVPVYILHGRYDYQTSHTLAKQYFEGLQAPYKAFYTFSESAHSPLFDEPERFCQILRDEVLTGEVPCGKAG